MKIRLMKDGSSELIKQNSWLMQTGEERVITFWGQQLYVSLLRRCSLTGNSADWLTKPHTLLQNLLLTDESDGAELKVVDFGFARLKPKREIGEEGGGMRTPCFTLQYAAPEVLEQAILAGDAKVRVDGL